MKNDPLALSDALVTRGAVQDAQAVLEQAARDGNGAAMFRLGAWNLVGSPVARDFEKARRWLRLAADLHHVDAAFLDIALTGNGTGGKPDWQQARARLNQLATVETSAADQLRLLNAMNISTSGAPSAPFNICKIGSNPNVWHIAGFLTGAECLHIAQTAADLLVPATVVDPRSGQNVANPVRTSDGAVIGPMRESLVVQAINRRLAHVTDTDVRQGEALAVLRYAAGQQFRPHLDAINGARNQRIKTVIIYLNDGFVGGATTFAKSGLRVAPIAGDAIIFDNVRADGSIDPASQHAGEPVMQGVKWIATRWIRARPFDVWQGPESV